MSEAIEATNAVLKPILSDAMVYRGIATTMDVLTPGYYEVNAATEGVPDGMFSYGILKVFGTAHYSEQVYTPLLKLNSETNYRIARRTIEGNFVRSWGWYFFNKDA